MSKFSLEQNRFLRWAMLLVAAAAVVIGLLIVLRSRALPLNPQLARYVYGARATTPGADDPLPGTTPTHVLLDLGYLLVLGGLAGFFLILAVSKSGQRLAQYVAAATLIAAAANLVEDGMLYKIIPLNSSTWITVVGAATTIKWCAYVVALAGIPATAGILLRSAGAKWRRLRACRSGKEPSPDWWTGVLEKPSSQPASIRANAYWVPHAQAIIDDRKPGKVQALCLSGGGVRSACVAMGAMQEFSKIPAMKADDQILNRFPEESEPKLIDALDYVISVSGGGFSAAARLLAVQSPDTADPDPSAADPGAFPDPSAAAHTDPSAAAHTDPGACPKEETAPLISARFADGSPEFDYFRRNSSYIADSPSQLTRALAVLLKNLLASLSILFGLPVLLGWAVGYLLSRPDFSFAVLVPVPNRSIDDKNPDYLRCLIEHHGSWWAVGFFAFWAVIFTAVAIGVEMFGWKQQNEKIKLGLQRIAAGSAMFALLVFTISAGLPTLMRLCISVYQHAAENHGAAAATASGVVGLNYLAAIAAVAWKDRSAVTRTELTKLSWWRRAVSPGVLPIILVTVTIAVLGFAWLVTLGSVAAGVFETLTSDGVEGTHRHLSMWPFWLSAGALFIISSLDVTSLSLHPYYRQRLGKAFAVRQVDRKCAKRYAENEYTWLIKHGRVHAVPRAPAEIKPGVPVGGPKFIFAAAAALSGNGRPAPGLNAVSFVLGSDYIGGPELGFLNTRALFQKAPPRIRRDLTVITAVAVSGAAFASAMGRHQKGFEKLLAVSGARLGTWLPNPKFFANLESKNKKDAAKAWPKSLPSVRGAGYFYRELFGLNYKNARLVQITDGGHYDNLGLVEALRRRSRMIICIDGGGDTPPLLSGLAESVRLANYELGVSVKFDRCAHYLLADIAPGSGKSLDMNDALSSLKPRLAKRTVALGLIHYPDESGLPKDKNGRHGLLIYAKAVLCEDCPPWLQTYAASHPQFPHDPTFDQWFNEGQFAAYTELGRIMGLQVRDCLIAHHELNKVDTMLGID
jgi:hypothetical protein